MTVCQYVSTSLGLTHKKTNLKKENELKKKETEWLCGITSHYI